MAQSVELLYNVHSSKVSALQVALLFGCCRCKMTLEALQGVFTDLMYFFVTDMCVKLKWRLLVLNCLVLWQKLHTLLH